MRAIVCEQFSGRHGLQESELAAPTPNPDEVLVDVYAASVTFMDCLICRGLYQMKPSLPFVPGTDAAGVVTDIGSDVTRFKPGDRVACFHWTGAFAETMVAKEHRTVALPENVNFSTGCAILHNYTTAMYALRDRARLQRGESLLVHGAAGGVGLATVDLGRHLGAEVIATVGNDEKIALVQRYGATHVINTAAESIKDRVKELTRAKGADVIFDVVGGECFEQSLRCINWGGRILVVGFASGQIPNLPLNQPLLKNCSIVGVFTGLWADRFPDENQRIANTIMQLVSSGKLHPYVSSVRPLKQVGRAMQSIINRTAVGREVLAVRPSRRHTACATIGEMDNGSSRKTPG